MSRMPVSGKTLTCCGIALALLVVGASAVVADCTPVKNQKPIIFGDYYINGLGDANGCLVDRGPGGLVPTADPIYLYGNFPTDANPPLGFGNAQGSQKVLGVGTNTGSTLQIVVMPTLAPPLQNPVTVWAQIPGQPSMTSIGTYTYEDVWQGCAERNPTTYSRYFTVENNCTDTVVMQMVPPAVPEQWTWWQDKYGQGTNKDLFTLTTGASHNFDVPDCGAPSGNFRFYTGCTGSGIDNCKVGSPSGDLAGVNTLFEPTFGCEPSIHSQAPGHCAVNASATKTPGCSSATPSKCPALASPDNFDISAVDGYDFPMKIDVIHGSGCNRTSTDASMLDLASCPHENQNTLYSGVSSQENIFKQGLSLLTTTAGGDYRACVAPKLWFDTTTLGDPVNPTQTPCDDESAMCWYGCGGPCTDKTDPSCGGIPCKAGPTATHNGTKAINNTNWVTQLYAMGYRGYTWAYGDGIGLQQCDWGAQIKVTLCPNGGVPYDSSVKWAYSGGACSVSNGGSYDSLFDCQKANMKFSCDGSGMCTVDTGGSGTSYSDCVASLSLDCKDVPYGGTTVRNCDSTCG